MKNMTLKELCQYCNVSRRAVQGYEKMDLLQATGRTDRGYLLYDEAAQRRVLEIKRLQSFGFSLKEIADYEKMNRTEKAAVLESKYQRMILEYEAMGQRIEEIQKVMARLERMYCDKEVNI